MEVEICGKVGNGLDCLIIRVGLNMAEIVKCIYSPSKKYRVQVIKRNDGIYSTAVHYWMREFGQEFWTTVSTGLSLIGSKDSAEVIAKEQLRDHSLERIE